MKELLDRIDMIEAGTTLEHVAKALMLANGNYASYEDIPAEFKTALDKQYYFEMALAALHAIRIPTPEMGDAMAKKVVEMGWSKRVDGYMFITMWMAAMNAAMTVKSKPEKNDGN